jgi:hypothetical protein
VVENNRPINGQIALTDQHPAVEIDVAKSHIRGERHHIAIDVEVVDGVVELKTATDAICLNRYSP